MRRWPQWAWPLAAIIAVALILWWGFGRFYRGPIETLEAEIAEVRGDVEQARDLLDNNPALRERMAEYANRTLGSNEEEVDHALRSRLNDIVAAMGLDDAKVTTGRSSAKASPARRAFPRSGSWRELRDEADFVEREAAVSAEGSLERMIGLIDRIMAEPWLKRVDRLQIDQKDNGGRYSATIRLTTLYIPGRSPESGGPSSGYASDRLGRFAALISGSPFRVPPPPPPPQPEPEPKPEPAPPPPPAPPPFPWHEWLVTGVADGRDGPEAWLRNVNTGETRILRPGQSIEDAELASLEADAAVFRLGEARFRVLVGKSLSDRTPLVD